MAAMKNPSGYPVKCYHCKYEWLYSTKFKRRNFKCANYKCGKSLNVKKLLEKGLIGEFTNKKSNKARGGESEKPPR